MAGAWHIITPSYPPDLGGVADYTELVSKGLRDAGREVHVWCPEALNRVPRLEPWVHSSFRTFSFKGLFQMGRDLNQFSQPRKLLVQWVPHGFGWRAMNLAFCVWLLFRSWRGDEVQIMLHEAFLSFRRGAWRQSVAAAIQRIMTVVLLSSTRRVWMSSPSWLATVRPYCLRKSVRFVWLPVPSTIAVLATGESKGKARATHRAGGKPIVGHFGTYGKLTTRMLDQILPPVLVMHPTCKLLLIGANSEAYRESLIVGNPCFADRIVATGAVDPEVVSHNLAACDLMIQPYPEGVTARRTTCLAGLSHGKAIVTTWGAMTEDFWWVEPQCVAMARDCQQSVEITSALLSDQQKLERLGEQARRYYGRHFALENLLRILLTEAAA